MAVSLVERDADRHLLIPLEVDRLAGLVPTAHLLEPTREAYKVEASAPRLDLHPLRAAAAVAEGRLARGDDARRRGEPAQHLLERDALLVRECRRELLHLVGVE